MKVVVSDTSAISNLLSIGRIHILQQVFGEVMIPPTVAAELSVIHNNIPQFITTRVVDPSVSFGSEVDLDPGETEAIRLALEVDADVLVIDDKAGRSAASTEGIKCIGILGILILAKKLGYLNLVAPVLDDLKINNFHFSDAVKTRVLQRANEIN